MKTKKYVYWYDGQRWYGYLEDYPDTLITADNEKQLQRELKIFYQQYNTPNMLVTNVRYMGDLDVIDRC